MAKWAKNVAGQIATVLAYEDDGVTPVAAADHALVLAQLKIRSTGNNYVAAAGALVAITDGEFEYTATQAETNHDGTVTLFLYQINVYAPTRTYVDIENDTAVAAAVLAAFRAWSHDGGVTWAGLQIRLEAFLSGKFDTSGTTPQHRKFYKTDGVSIAFEGDFTPDTGGRSGADVSGSE